MALRESRASVSKPTQDSNENKSNKLFQVIIFTKKKNGMDTKQGTA